MTNDRRARLAHEFGYAESTGNFGLEGEYLAIRRDGPSEWRETRAIPD